MPEILGRKVSIKIDGSVIAAARTKSLTINNETINITADGDDGIARYLTEAGEKSVEISVDGLMVDDALLTKALGSDISAVIIFTYPTYTITGTFVMPSYGEGLPYNEAITFNASFSSSGAIVKAAV